MNIAIILSGGTGTRLGADIPKQYIEVNGRTIISYCLECFEACEDIDVIQVVADSAWQETIAEERFTKIIGFSKPGETRQLSIVSGLEDVKAYISCKRNNRIECDMGNGIENDIEDEKDSTMDNHTVIIHDAARPLVSEKLLKRLIDATASHQGAMPVLPMKDTVYYSKDGQSIDSLLERKCIFAGQAPEAFKLGAYYNANRKLSEDEMLKINGSTEPAILAGMDVVMVDGEENNFKITTREDLERFKQKIK